MSRQHAVVVPVAVSLIGWSAAALAVLTMPLALSGASPVEAPPFAMWSVALTRLAVVVTVVLFAGLAVVGTWWGRRGQDSRAVIGALGVAVGWAALAPSVWLNAPALRGLAVVLAALVAPSLAQIMVSVGPADSMSRRWRSLVAAAYSGTAVLAGMHVLSRDPFLDPECVAHCSSFTPPLASPRLADATAIGLTLMSTTIGAFVVAACSTRCAHEGPRAALISGAVCGATEVAWALWPGLKVLAPILPVRALAYAALGAALLVHLVHRARRRAALRHLARDILAVTPPRTAVDVLRAGLNDPRAGLAFHVPGDEAWVDSTGAEDQDVDVPGAQSVLLRRAGLPVARITTTAPDVAARDVADVLGPATMLALESERTGAEARVRLRQLRTARRAVVEASDAARRRAERDLHDGAQHLLLAATFALHDAVEAARELGQEARATMLTAAADELREGAAELRRVAHGIYPPLLRDSGLVPALEGLALASPVPMTLDATAVPRLPAPVELTIYGAVTRALHAARIAPLRVELTHDGSTVSLRVRGADLDPTTVEAISDRVLALEGTMKIVNTGLTLEVPCE